MITLFVALAGRWFCLDVVLGCIDKLNYDKKKIKLILCDTSSDQKFHEKIKYWAIEREKNYDKVKIIRYYQHVILGKAEYQDNAEKMRNISRMYEDTKKYIDTDLVFFVEDDIEYPPDSLKKLVPILEKDKKVIMATGRVISRFPPSPDQRLAQVIYITGKGESKTWRCSPPKEKGIEQVQASTWGCSLARSDIIKTTCLYNYGWPDWGQDAVLGYKMLGTKNKIMIDWSIQCRHYDESGKIYS